MSFIKLTLTGNRRFAPTLSRLRLDLAVFSHIKYDYDPFAVISNP